MALQDFVARGGQLHRHSDARWAGGDTCQTAVMAGFAKVDGLRGSNADWTFIHFPPNYPA